MYNNNMLKDFKGRKLVIATMHQKEKVIKPILEKELGVDCFILENFNTDKFGTFTREVKRHNDMYKTAKNKANTAMEISGCDLAVASEGSFGPHSQTPFIQSNLELTLLIDKKNNLEIVAYYENFETNNDSKYIYNLDEAFKFAKKNSFPSHGIIVRKTKNDTKYLFKNIKTKKDLEKKVTEILSLPNNSRVFLETDMRAHKNPTRMKGIKFSVKNLVKNIKSKCPECKTLGFVVTGIEKGLLCGICKTKTNLPKNEISVCSKCNYKQKIKITKYGKFADPGQCEICNP